MKKSYLMLFLLLGGLYDQVSAQPHLIRVDLYYMDFDMRYSKSLFETQVFKSLVLSESQADMKGFEYTGLTDSVHMAPYKDLRDKLSRTCCHAERFEWFDYRLLIELGFSDGHTESIAIWRLCDDCPAKFNGYQCYQMREILLVAQHDIEGKIAKQKINNWLEKH